MDETMCSNNNNNHTYWTHDIVKRTATQTKHCMRRHRQSTHTNTHKWAIKRWRGGKFTTTELAIIICQPIEIHNFSKVLHNASTAVRHTHTQHTHACISVCPSSSVYSNCTPSRLWHCRRSLPSISHHSAREKSREERKKRPRLSAIASLSCSFHYFDGLFSLSTQMWSLLEFCFCHVSISLSLCPRLHVSFGFSYLFIYLCSSFSCDNALVFVCGVFFLFRECDETGSASKPRERDRKHQIVLVVKYLVRVVHMTMQKEIEIHMPHEAVHVSVFT